MDNIYADVSVPFQLTPYVTVSKIETICCGEPIITLQNCCSCGCEIIVKQTICIHIALQYGAKAEAGDMTSCCKKKCEYGIPPGKPMK